MSFYMNSQVRSDLLEIIDSDIDWGRLSGKRILVTGATGMLASYFGFILIFLNEVKNLRVKPIFLARNINKVHEMFGPELGRYEVLIQDVSQEIKLEGNVDLVLHAAGNSSPEAILKDPVGIVNANVIGTQNVLKLCIDKKVEKIIFTSTREIYGDLSNQKIIKENDFGKINSLDPRNCYPESKRLAEAMLLAYSRQFGVNFITLRIAHCYGPCMTLGGDGRVMANFLNNALENKDIVLNSNGQMERAFCYVADAVNGIFRVMLHGEHNTAYNISNEDEPVKVLELAKKIQKISGFDRAVILKVENNNIGYTNYTRTKLSNGKIKELGWICKVDLDEGLTRVFNFFEKKNV